MTGQLPPDGEEDGTDTEAEDRLARNDLLGLDESDPGPSGDDSILDLTWPVSWIR